MCWYYCVWSVKITWIHWWQTKDCWNCGYWWSWNHGNQDSQSSWSHCHCCFYYRSQRTTSQRQRCHPFRRLKGSSFHISPSRKMQHHHQHCRCQPRYQHLHATPREKRSHRPNWCGPSTPRYQPNRAHDETPINFRIPYRWNQKHSRNPWLLRQALNLARCKNHFIRLNWLGIWAIGNQQ